jgi:hypothetical protein
MNPSCTILHVASKRLRAHVPDGLKEVREYLSAWLLDIRLKRLQRKRQHTVSTRKRKLLGIPRSNHHGSPNSSFRRKFNRHSCEPRLRLSQKELEYRVGTPAEFARAIVRICGTGGLWPS